MSTNRYHQSRKRKRMRKTNRNRNPRVKNLRFSPTTYRTIYKNGQVLRLAGLLNFIALAKRKKSTEKELVELLAVYRDYIFIKFKNKNLFYYGSRYYYSFDMIITLVTELSQHILPQNCPKNLLYGFDNLDNNYNPDDWFLMFSAYEYALKLALESLTQEISSINYGKAFTAPPAFRKRFKYAQTRINI